MDDPSLGEVTLLWSAASSVDNSVLIKNMWPATGSLVSDQAYYPEPPDPNVPPPPPDHLWRRMFQSTSYSNLGNYLPPFYQEYTPVQNNFYADPLLEALTWLSTSLGKVYPGTSAGTLSPLIDFGGGTVFAPENTDVRGPGFPREVDFGLNGIPVRDVGAFEVQN
jgi:hypothetical protein